MIKALLAVLVFGATACGSDSDVAAAPNGGASGTSSCPDVSGAWKVTKHCDASLVGAALTVTQKECALTFSSPFDAFMGSVTAAGAITLSGPQSCTGTATADAVSMNCTPGTCEVTLGR